MSRKLTIEEVKNMLAGKQLEQSVKAQTAPSAQQAPSAPAPKRPGKFGYYMSLCAQKGVDIDMTLSVGRHAELQQEIDRINKLPDFRAMSSKQEAFILKRCEEVGVPVPPAIKTFSTKSASAFIDQLKVMEEKLGDQLEPTEWQLNELALMYQCPDVFFEELSDEFGWLEVDADGQKFYKKALDTTEMLIFVAEHVSRNQAKEFIWKYKKAFEIWKHERISEDKAIYINALLKKYGQAEMEIYDLMAFDKTTADEFIRTIQYEPTILSKFYVVEFGETQREDEEPPKTIQDAQLRLWEEIRAFGARLLAVLGQTTRNDHMLDSPTILDDLVEYSKLALEGGFTGKQELIDLLDSSVNDVATKMYIMHQLDITTDTVQSDDKPF